MKTRIGFSYIAASEEERSLREEEARM